MQVAVEFCAFKVVESSFREYSYLRWDRLTRLIDCLPSTSTLSFYSPDDVSSFYAPRNCGTLRYFNRLFPGLLMECYNWCFACVRGEEIGRSLQGNSPCKLNFHYSEFHELRKVVDACQKFTTVEDNITPREPCNK